MTHDIFHLPSPLSHCQRQSAANTFFKRVFNTETAIDFGAIEGAKACEYEVAAWYASKNIVHTLCSKCRVRVRDVGILTVSSPPIVAFNPYSRRYEQKRRQEKEKAKAIATEKSIS